MKFALLEVDEKEMEDTVEVFYTWPVMFMQRLPKEGGTKVITIVDPLENNDSVVANTEGQPEPLLV